MSHCYISINLTNLFSVKYCTCSMYNFICMYNPSYKQDRDTEKKLNVYLLNKEWPVINIPLITWKSPVWNLVTISCNRSGHLSGKSSLPIILIESLNWKYIYWIATFKSAYLSTGNLYYQSSVFYFGILPICFYYLPKMFKKLYDYYFIKRTRITFGSV